ncbi:hypothetical protein GCM10019016_060140 [Streptomyces prasinosporus]|uniref:Uncharacterized protein n=1 Tax=Streptomyces prasinosporus TaxID=68256 RepID=A0ABP6TXU7_9ACTN
MLTVDTTVARARDAAAGRGWPRLPPSWWMRITDSVPSTVVEMQETPERRPVTTASTGSGGTSISAANRIRCVPWP